MVTPAAWREAVAHLCEVHGVSQRRACTAIGADRTSIRYRSRRPDDGAVRSRPRELAVERRRFGWRRLKVLLSREGVRMNHKKLRRLYVEERLQVRRRIGRKRAAPIRVPLLPAQGPNRRWSMDFALDTVVDGRKIRILSVVDDFTRESLCLVADTSLPATRVIRELKAVIAVRGLPRQCVSDNGPASAWRCCAGRRRSISTGATSIPATAAERVCRELQRSAARRVLERDAVYVAPPGPRRARSVAARLQHRTTAQCARRPHAGRIRRSHRLSSATGWGAALNRGLRAPACCNTGPDRSKWRTGSTSDWMKVGAQVSG